MNWKIILEIESVIFLMLWIFLLIYGRAVFSRAWRQKKPFSKGIMYSTLLGLFVSGILTLLAFFGRPPASTEIALLGILLRVSIGAFGLINLLVIRSIYQGKEPFLTAKKQDELAEELGIQRWQVNTIIRRFIDG